MMKEMMHIAKKDRKKLLMLGVFALLGIGLMLFSSSIGERKDRTASDAKAGENDIVSEEDTAAALGALLSEIKGAGAVDVEIYRDSDGFRTYAYNEEIRKTSGENGSEETNTRRELVLVDDDHAPVLISEEKGEIRGVLIVAEGAVDQRVREQLFQAASAYLDIGRNRIDVTAREVR